VVYPNRGGGLAIQCSSHKICFDSESPKGAGVSVSEQFEYRDLSVLCLILDPEQISLIQNNHYRNLYIPHIYFTKLLIALRCILIHLI